MNIVMESSAEYVNGSASGSKYNDVFIRGNNGMYKRSRDLQNLNY